MFAFILRHFYFAFNSFFFQTLKYLSYVPYSLRCICRGVTIVYLKWYAPPYERVLTSRQNLFLQNMCIQGASRNVSTKDQMQVEFSQLLFALNPFISPIQMLPVRYSANKSPAQLYALDFHFSCYSFYNCHCYAVSCLLV